MMALDNHFLFSHHLNSPDNWDHHSLGSLGEDLHDFNMPLDTESPMSSEASTGYLQDAVAEWKDRSKRRRVASSCPLDDHAISTSEDIQDLLQVYWDSNCHENHLGKFNWLVKESATFSTADDHDILNYFSMPIKEASTATAPELGHQKEPMPTSPHKEENHSSRDSKPPLPPSSPKVLARGKTEKGIKVVYPFAVVKPGGVEGDVTLDDINERILMRPTRTVKHPVGEFAYGPCVNSAGEPGLSGKAVVGLTRIHTRGRGTITIIRTRG